MATIDLSLDALKIPALDNFNPDFGTMITETQANKGGLSTFEVNSNMMLPWAYMRPKVVVEDSVTTVVEYDAKLTFSASLQAGVTLTMDSGDYEGCEVSLRNLSAYACTVGHGTFSLEIPAGGFVRILWNGTTWEADVSSTVGSGIILPPTAAAVHAAIGDVTTIQDLSSQITNKISEVQNCVLKKYGDICFLTFTFSTTFTQPDGMVLFNLPVTPKNTTWYVTSTPNSSQRLYAIDTANTSVKMWWGNNQNIFLDHYVSVVFLAE